MDSNLIDRMARGALCLVLAGLLAGCGSGDAQEGGGGDSANGAFPGADAVPASVKGTREAEGIDCGGLPKADPAQRNDILGITPGMPAETAYRMAACANPNFQVKYSESGFSVAPLPDGRRPRGSIEIEGGLDDATIYLMGMPGEEKVVAVTRVTEFADGREPTIEQLAGQVSAKYGALIPNRYSPDRATILYASSGEKLGADNQDLDRCANAVGFTDNRVGSVYGDCGLTVNDRVAAKSSNPQLARRFSRAVVDQKCAMGLIEATQSTIRDAHAAARQAEIDRANADAQKAGSENRVPQL